MNQVVGDFKTNSYDLKFNKLYVLVNNHIFSIDILICVLILYDYMIIFS